MTREQWNKHKEAIEWFYKQPEWTEIWARPINNICDWDLYKNPTWELDWIYVINDEYAELRKAIADGKEIEVLEGINIKTWCLLKNKNLNQKFRYSDVKRYRIKIKKEFPIYKKNNFMVVRFDSENECEIVFIFNKEKARKYYSDLIQYLKNDLNIGSKLICNFDNEWEDVLYDEEKGLWDGQPVWCWDKDDNIGRGLCFYDAKNKTVFYVTGERGYYIYDYYEPYPHLDDEWIIEAYNKLNFES